MAQVSTPSAKPTSSRFNFPSFKGRQGAKETASTAIPLHAQDGSEPPKTVSQNLSDLPTGSVNPIQTETQSARPTVIRADNLNYDDDAKCDNAKEKCGNCMHKSFSIAKLPLQICEGIAGCCCLLGIGCMMWKEGMH